MSDELDTARDDLAFLRALVSRGADAQRPIGAALLAGGLIYGLPTLLYWLMAIGAVRLPQAAQLPLGAGPTVLFLAVLGWIVWRDRKAAQGVGGRAIDAAFGGAGLAAGATAFVFGVAAAREQDFSLWLYHPLMVCVVQGVVWYIAFAVRRKGWLGLVSLGWYATSAGLALLIDRMEGFLLLLGVALLLLMALPGWVLMRQDRRPA